MRPEAAATWAAPAMHLNKSPDVTLERCAGGQGTLLPPGPAIPADLGCGAVSEPLGRPLSASGAWVLGGDHPDLEGSYE